MQLQEGMTIKVFQEPLGEGQRFEGVAVLREQHRPDEGDGLSMWWVEFADDPGAECLRTINAQNALGSIA